MSTDTFGGDCTDAEFGLGDIVEVSRRMWPGMNKQGGIAKITGIHRDNDSDSYLYDVKYIVVNGGESKVNPIYITRKDDLSKSKRDTKGRCRFCNSLVVDCKHDQTATSDPTYEMEEDEEYCDVPDVVMGSDESSDSEESTVSIEAPSQLPALESSTIGRGAIATSVERNVGNENLDPRIRDNKKIAADLFIAIRSSNGILTGMCHPQPTAPRPDSEYEILLKALQLQFTPEMAMEMAHYSNDSFDRDVNQSHERYLAQIKALTHIIYNLKNANKRDRQEYENKIRNIFFESGKGILLAERSGYVCFHLAHRWWIRSYFNLQNEKTRTSLKKCKTKLRNLQSSVDSNEHRRISLKKDIFEFFKKLCKEFGEKFYNDESYWPNEEGHGDSRNGVQDDDINDYPPKAPKLSSKALDSANRGRDREQDHGAYTCVPIRRDVNPTEGSNKKVKSNPAAEFIPKRKREKDTANFRLFRVHGINSKENVYTENTPKRVSRERNDRRVCNKQVLSKLFPTVTATNKSRNPDSEPGSSRKIDGRNLRIMHYKDYFSHSDLDQLFEDFYNVENESNLIDTSTATKSTLSYRINYMRAIHHSSVRAYPIPSADAHDRATTSFTVTTTPDSTNGTSATRREPSEMSFAQWAENYFNQMWYNATIVASIGDKKQHLHILGNFFQPVLLQSVLRTCANFDHIHSAVNSSNASHVDWETPIGNKIEVLISDCMLTLQKVNCLCSQSASILAQHTKDSEVVGSFLSILRSIDSKLLAKFRDIRERIINSGNSLRKNLAYDFSLFAYLSFNEQRSATISKLFSHVLNALRVLKADDSNLLDTLSILFDEQKAIMESCILFLMQNHRLLDFVIAELKEVDLEDMGRIRDENNFSEFQPGRSRLALHIICYYQLVLHALDDMHRKALRSIKKDPSNKFKFKFWGLIGEVISSFSSHSSKYSRLWTDSVSIANTKLVGVPNPNICHLKSEQNAMRATWEVFWGICSVTSYLLYSIRLNDFSDKDKRIEGNHRIIRALCTFACDRVVHATAAGTLTSRSKELKQFYQSLYRLSNLAFIVARIDFVGEFHLFVIYLKCVSKIAKYVSTCQKGDSADRDDDSDASAKSVLSLSFLAYYAGRSSWTISQGVDARVPSTVSWKESIDLLKHRLHQDLLEAVNSLFNQCNLLNPYRLYNRIEVPNQRIESAVVRESMDDIEKLRSILRSLLWNLTHKVSSPGMTNSVQPHYERDDSAVQVLGDIICFKKDEIRSIFRNYPSFTTGLLVSLILKELTLAGANDDDGLYNIVAEDIIISNLPDEQQRSCLLWFTAAVCTNPFPVREHAEKKQAISIHKSIDTMHFIREQQNDQKSLCLLCKVAEKSREIFHAFFRTTEKDSDPIVKLSLQLMNTTISACSSLMHFHLQFLRKCCEAGALKYEVVILPRELLQTTLKVLATSIWSAGSTLTTKGSDSHIVPTIYLTTAVIEYLTIWAQYQFQLSEIEQDTNSLGENKKHIGAVKSIRQEDAEAVASFTNQIEKDIIANLKIIFSKASLHKIDCLKEDYQISTEFPQTTYEDDQYVSTSDIWYDREILNRLKSSDCCIATVKAYESFIRLRILIFGKLLQRQSSIAAEKQLFENYYDVINTLQKKFTLDNALVVSFSQCWYKCLFLNPLFDLLYDHDSDLIDRIVDTSPTVDACSKRIRSANIINATIFSLLQSRNVLDYYNTFLMIALTEPIMPSVSSRIQFSQYCQNLLVFSCCVLTEPFHSPSSNVAAVLPYARLFVESFLQSKPQSGEDSSMWIANASELFLSLCIEFRDIHRVVPRDLKLNICDILLRAVKFIRLCSFHVRSCKEHYREVSDRAKGMCATVVLKCRLSQIQRANEFSLVVNTDQDQLIEMFSEFIWGDTNELLKLLFNFKYLLLATQPMSWTVSQLSVELLGADENHAFEIDRHMYVLDNLCHYIVLIFSIPFATKCKTWMCILQLLLISAVHCPTLEHAQVDSVNSTLEVMHRLQSACEHVDIIWAAALCRMSPEMERQLSDLKSNDRMRSIFKQKLKAGFAFLQNASADRLNAICEWISAIARGRSYNYQADGSNNNSFNTSESFRQGFSAFLLNDPSDILLVEAQDLLTRLFDDEDRCEEHRDGKRSFVSRCVSWQRAKNALTKSISAIEVVAQEAWASFIK